MVVLQYSVWNFKSKKATISVNLIVLDRESDQLTLVSLVHYEVAVNQRYKNFVVKISVGRMKLLSL